MNGEKTNTFPVYDQSILQTPIGKILITTTDQYLIGICFLLDKTNTNVIQTEFLSPLINTVIDQLQQYFKNPYFQFNLPIAFESTPFQARVLKTLQNIPIGQTRTYSEIATILKTSPRAIGNACRFNPLPIIIPCHRVIGKQQRNGGFCGQTNGKLLTIKKWLITHEAGNHQTVII